MPHVHVKMVAGRTEEQKKALAAALEKAMGEAIGVDSKYISIAIDDYTAEQWQDVFKAEIADKKLYKEPGYDPKSLL